MMEDKLRNIIRASLESDSLFKRDWDRIPLPQLDFGPLKPAPQQKTFPPPAPAKKQSPASANLKKGKNRNGFADPWQGEGELAKKAQDRRERFSKAADFHRPMYQDIGTVRSGLPSSNAVAFTDRSL